MCRQLPSDETSYGMPISWWFRGMKLSVKVADRNGVVIEMYRWSGTVNSRDMISGKLIAERSKPNKPASKRR